MPVPTQRKKGRRALINAGQPTAHFLRFNTAGRRMGAAVFAWLATPVEGETHRRATLKPASYRHFVELLPAMRAEYNKYLASGEPRVFA